MKKLIVVSFFVAVLSLVLVLPAKASATCSGARGPSFEIGDRFIIPPDDVGTWLYEGPNKLPAIVELPVGTEGTIIDGPQCVAGEEGNLYSWFIESDSGYRGWVSEGYSFESIPWIEPVEEVEPTVKPTAKPRATSAPVSQNDDSGSSGSSSSNNSQSESDSPAIPTHVYFLWLVLLAFSFMSNYFLQKAFGSRFSSFDKKVSEWPFEKSLFFSVLFGAAAGFIVYVVTNDPGAAVATGVGGGAPPIVSLVRRSMQV